MGLDLYLDDCAYSKRLAAMLLQAGHRVVVPSQVGTSKQDDDVHFGFARAHGLMIVTKNPGDFRALHHRTPDHPGIIVICEDNDISRDMSHPEIVAAIGRLEEIGHQNSWSLANQVHELNQWRISTQEAPASVEQATPPSPPAGNKGKKPPRKPKKVD